MAGSIGVVRQVVGEVFAVAADGSRRLLTEGDRVFAGEQLVTGAQGAVAVALANGQELVLGRESSMALNNSLLAGTPDATQSAAADSAATPSEQDLTDVEKLQAAIEAGVDPTQAAEATAAGPGSGGGGSGNAGGGHSFVLLGETAGRVDPNIGFPTGPIGSVPEFPNPDVAIAAEELEVVVPPVNGVPVAEDDAQTVEEGGEGVQGNVLDNDDGGPDLPTQFLSWQAPGASSGPNGSLLVSTPYGVVTLNPDGSYNFELANGTPAVEGLGEGETVNIDFGYSIQDGNGDQSSANLTITIVGQNDVPTVEVNFPNAEGGVVRVFERGLPGGSSEGDGSNVVHGTFTIRDPDGLDKLKSLGVGGLDLQIDPDHPLASLIGGGFEAAFGTVRITGFDASTGTFSFSYTLTRPISDLAAGDERDGFLISLSDGLGLPISTNVSIEIVDDVPQANPDSGSLTENGVPSSLSGNVLGNDVGGADQPKAFTSWNGVAGATTGENGSLLVNTPYGVVTLNADGSYSFALANGSAAVEALTEGQQVTLQYAYSMQDADGDPSNSTLTLTIIGSNDIPTIEVSTPDAENGLAQVFEKGLADGSSAGDGSTVTTGSFTVADSDGLANLKTLSVGSLTVDLTTSGFASLVGQSFAAAHGTVLITGYSNGTYSFSYTLTEAITDTAGPETDGFLINVGDGLANASATVTIEIVDDVPQANPDSGGLTENGVPSSLSGNVLGNDVGGADQPKAFTSWNGVAGATTGENGSLQVNTPYGVVTLNADGSYSFALANGSAAVEALTEGQQVTLQYAYSMQDADGDPSNSTLTLTITGSNDIPTIEVSTPDAEGGLAQVFEKGLADGSSAGDGSNITTGSFTVADSDGLANLKTLSVGSLTVDLTTSGFASLVGQSFAAAHGTVLITGYSNGTYSFSYTLTEAITDTAGPETDGFLINVGDGLANASATVTIEIVDDVPQAKADDASVSEGSSVSGNVVSGAGLGSVADVFGADGRPSPATGVVGVRTGGDVSTPAAGGVGVPIDTGLGTLVLHADGSYTYTSHANALGQAGAVDTFTYTIVDADGDLSTTTLTIDLSNITVVGDVKAGSDDDVREAALGFGSEPTSNDEFASGTLVANGGNGPYSFSLGVGAGTGQYGQLVVNSNGSYTYTLISAPKVNPDNNGNNLQFTETFTFTVTDANGNTGIGTLTIDIIDDVPSISVRGLEGLDLQVDETTLGATDSTSFAGAFSSVFGADGAALSNAITYSLDVKSPGVDSGLRDTATGSSILLFKEGADIVGRVVGGGQLAFRLSVAADGTLTLDQSRAIFHTPNDGPDQAAGLAGTDLITLNATITDGDGDQDSASLDLGNAISFKDDAPSIDPYVKVCLDDDALPYGNPGGEGDSDPDTRNTSGTIAHDFGADGPGEIELQDSGAPHGFTYVETQGGLLIKQGDVTVITITLDKFTGAYTVTQNAPILHANGYDENDLTFEVEYKIVDRDGDRADGSLYIKVDDDTPMVSTSPVVQLDDDALPGGNAYGMGDVTPDTANVTGKLGHSFGADGPGSITLLTSGAPDGFSYEKHGDNLLIKQGGLTVLTLTLNWATGAYSVVQNNPIMHPAGYDENDVSFSIAYKVTDADGDSATGSLVINVDDDTPKAYADSASIIEGSVPATLGGNVLDNDAGGADQTKAFTRWNGVAGATPGDNGSLLVSTPYGVVTLNADGSYSFALANGSAAVEALEPGEQVVLHYAYSMRDADGDASDSTLTLTIIGSNDTPTVEVSFPDAQGGMAQVYEKGLPEGSSAGDGSTQVDGTFTIGDPDGLGDLQSLSVGGLTVDLTTSDFTSLVGQSFTTAHGTVQITGYSNGTYSFSYTLTEATTDGAGPETDGFQITVSDGVTSAWATATIEIVDDLPQAKADGASVSEGSSVNGNVVSGAGLGSVADVFGADGRPSPTTGVVGVRTGNDTSTPVSGDVGVPIDTGLGTLVLHADGSYTYTSHANSVGQAGAVDTFTYSIVDADGDLSTTTLTINVSNYTVVGSVQAGSDQDVREAALSFGSAPTSNDEFASGTLVGSGGNGPYSFSLGVGAGNGQYGQLVLGSNGSYTYTLLSAPKVNPGNNGNNLQFTETFTFQVVDANGNTGTGSLTVSIVDDVPDISVTSLGALGAQVDETNLSLNASTSFAGAFTTVFGADGAAVSNAITYSLDVKSVGVDSGLKDTATGNSILLSKVGSDIVGLVSGSGQVAFRLSVAADGTVTLDQQRAIIHSPDSGPDQVAGLSSADLITLTATITDGDGDKDSATLDLGCAISFRDAAPTVNSNVVVQLDDDALPGGIPNGSGDDPDSANATGSVGFGFGADGAGDVQWLTTGAPDGFTYVKSGTTLLIKQGTTTVIEVTLDSTTGAYGVTQLAPIQHALGDQENDQLFTLAYQVADKDGDSTNGTLDIKVDDDTPHAKNDSADVAEGCGQDFNVVSGNVLLGSDNAVGGGDDDAFGADGAGRIQSIQIGTVTYNWNGAGSISLSSGGSLSGNVLSAITTPGGGKLSFDFTTGAWTYVASNDVVADTSESFTYSIIDKDGDPSSASLTVRIEDASPVIGRVDEDELPGGITDGDAQTTVVTGNLGELLVGTPVGAQFSVTATPQAMPVLTSDGVAVTYSREGDTLVAKADADTVFTLQVGSDGSYTFTLLGALDHPGGAGGDDQILTLNLTGALQASNGSGNLPLAGDLLIQVEDDIPTILAASNLVYSNSSNPGGATGVFDYSTGADTRGSGPFSATDSDFTSISLSGTVGGSAISSTAVTWVSETASTATFDISFRYAPNPASPGVLDDAAGTLVFDKANGTYTVSLNEPIQGFTIFKTSTSLSISGYEVNSTLPDNTQPAVSVVELDNDFYVQYTSYSEPGSGTDEDNLRAGTDNTSVFSQGELFSQSTSWVSVSNLDNGVGGDTLGKGEVLDLNFYTSNPKGNLGVEPSARAAGMFLKFDGVGNEDLVVVLKLIGAGGTKTTRALVVSNSDIMTANSVALAAYGITLGNNDGAIVIESNDFNASGESWQIYGAQILTSVEDITTSSAIDFNSALGGGGASNVANGTSFGSSATDNDVLKVSDIGFITAESNTLDTELDFQVGIKDADGDSTSTQSLHVTMEAGSTFVGTTTSDVIQGTSGSDHLSGMAGDDVLVGGLGNDVMDGGVGSDTVSYDGANVGVAVDLALIGQQNTGGGGLDTLIDIENLLGSRFDDVLTGNSGDNVLAGNGGDDLLDGGAGADTFKWLPGDSGVTTIAGFNPGVDKLDLSQLLSGEHSDVGSLDDYLTMAFGANTTITVDSNAAAAGGEGQTIVLQGVNLMAAYSAPDTASVISHMLDDGSLKVDV
ncbi:retention module-containing protein [Metapseudomonas resinovorans]|uniref:retention module-containing protein n=1 Tax=Metapseudomonas resinovorans TaxID=53412 RepID=UPI0004221BE4|nr:retention module-containing protein [Pseudomonas resinovorans]